MPYTRDWDETDPRDTDEARYGAREIREAKQDTRERIQSDAFVYAGTATGTVNAIVVTLSPTPVDLMDGMRIVFKPIGNNTVIAPTLQVTGFLAKPIVKYNNEPLVKGDISPDLHFAIVRYSSALDKFVLENPRNLDMIMCIAHGETSQSVTANIHTVVWLSGAEYDPYSICNAVNNHIYIPRDGSYLLSASVLFDMNAAGSAYIYFAAYTGQKVDYYGIASASRTSAGRASLHFNRFLRLLAESYIQLRIFSTVAGTIVKDQSIGSSKVCVGTWLIVTEGPVRGRLDW